MVQLLAIFVIQFSSTKIRKIIKLRHLTGRFRGAACAKCNRHMIQTRRSLVIYFHNYRGYDNHHIVFGFASRQNWDIEPIAENLEKFMSMRATFSIETSNVARHVDVFFRDSFQVLPAGLATLVSSVGEAELHQTNKMKNIYGVSAETINAKGIFPYTFFNDYNKMQYPRSPDIDDFETKTTELEYQRAGIAWREFNCQNVGDYMKRYLEMDVRQLCDVYENFRSLTREQSGLDGAHYMTISQFALSAALKKKIGKSRYA